MEQLSVYILTYNSPKYLAQLLECCKQMADELVIIDSGSTDNTLQIAESFGCKIFTRKLDNFREQRNFAHQCCTYKWTLALDSDEVPSQELVDAVNTLKQTGFTSDAYCIKRNWNVLGKWVHAMPPVPSPDYPIRLLNKEIAVFDERSTRSHETAHGYKTLGVIEAPILHYTFETKDELENKLKLYSSLSADDLLEGNRPVSIFKLVFSPPAAWFKWYITKGLWKDGIVGLTIAGYAFRYTLLKYQLALTRKQ